MSDSPFSQLYGSVSNFLKLFFDEHLGFEQVFLVGPVPDIAMESTGCGVMEKPTRTAEVADAFKTQVFNFQRQQLRRRFSFDGA
jgi:hypothetical protein